MNTDNQPEENNLTQLKTPNYKTLYILGGAVFLFVVAYLIFSKFNSQKLVVTQNTVTPISLSEISTHNNKDSCWTTINGGVYDVTSFITKHEGGDRILAACGIDATDLFTGKSPMGRVHSQFAVKLLGAMKIGTLQK